MMESNERETGQGEGHQVLVDLSQLDDSGASEKLLNALKKLNDSDPNTMRHGCEEIVILVKRTDDVSDVLDILLKPQCGLLQRLLQFMNPELIHQYEGEVTVRGVAVVPVSVKLGEALQLAALTTVGELIWQRDTSSEVRPVLLEVDGVSCLAKLLAETTSERVRLKSLVLTRRLLYEVGSTAIMDPSAIVAVQECGLLDVLIILLQNVIRGDDEGYTMDTLEGVTYLLQRMQACMNTEQKISCDLNTHIQLAAESFTRILLIRTSPELLEMALLAVRELCWDDHGEPLEPAMTKFAEAGAFEAVAALLAPIPETPEEGSAIAITNSDESAAEQGAQAAGYHTHGDVNDVHDMGSEGSIYEPPIPLMTAVQQGTVTKQIVGLACQLLERIAAAPALTLPATLEAQIPRLFHQVVYHLVEQLDTSVDASDRQETALFALRKLLTTEHSQQVPKVAAESAEAEGVPARLLAVALSGEPFGGPGDADGGGGASEETARAAAALLADITAAAATLSAEEGRPAQAAETLSIIEPLVTPLIGQLSNNVEACRALCKCLQKLSMVKYDQQMEEAELEDLGLSSAVTKPAPPEEEQYALSSQLVTIVARVAQGIRGLLEGGYTVNRKAGAQPVNAIQAILSMTPGQENGPVLGHQVLGLALSSLQRATMLIHDLSGLRPHHTFIEPPSKHNVDALFVHGTMQALVNATNSWYTHRRAQLKAEADALAVEEEARVTDDNSTVGGASGFTTPDRGASRASSIAGFSIASSAMSSASAKANPLLYPLLNMETGALELLKELARDSTDARVKLRDVGALPMLARMLSENLRDNLLVSTQFNLARSPSLHAALRKEGCIGLMDKVLSQAPQFDGAHHEVRRLLALCVLGIVGSETQASGDTEDSDSKKAASLLAKHDIAGMMDKVMREACRDGRYIISSSTSAWPFLLDPAAYTVGCLAKVETMARKLTERNIPMYMLTALRNKHGSAPEAALHIMRALLNFLRVPDVRPKLLAWGAVDVLQVYTSSEDSRIADAAKGCLLQLGELADPAARTAYEGSLPVTLQAILSTALPKVNTKVRPRTALSRASTRSRRMSAASQGTDTGSIEGEGAALVTPRREKTPKAAQFAKNVTVEVPGDTSNKDAATAAAGTSIQFTNSGDEDRPGSPHTQSSASPRFGSYGATPETAAYDVLICYKRQDASNLARTLHTALVLRGIGCLLDFEYQQDLSDVERVVARARNLLVILSDNCLTSPRSLAEMQAAVNHDVNVIMVLKEGARWVDSNGTLLTQPPQQFIKGLRPDLRGLFTAKPIHHRDEHYAYFIDQILKRVKLAPPPKSLPTAFSRAASMLSRSSYYADHMPPRRGDSNVSYAADVHLVRMQSKARVTSDQLDAPTLTTRNTLHASLSQRHISISRKSAAQMAAEIQVQAVTPHAAQVSGGSTATSSDLQALVTAVTAQNTLFTELARELGVVQSTVSQLAGLQSVVGSLQSAVTGLAGELGSLRREITAEVGSTGRKVAEEMSSITHHVRQACASELSNQTNMVQNLKADLSAALTGVKTDVQNSMGGQLRSLAGDVSEVRRGLADCVSGVVSVQNQMRMLMSGRLGDYTSNTIVIPSPSATASHQMPMYTDGTVHHSSPVRLSLDSPMGKDTRIDEPVSPLLHPITTQSTSTSGCLPHIHPHPSSTAGPNIHTHTSLPGNTLHPGGGHVPLHSSTMPGSRSSPSTSAGNMKKDVQGLGMLPPAYAPNVGGFQGARIAAVQNKLASLPRGRQ